MSLRIGQIYFGQITEAIEYGHEIQYMEHQKAYMGQVH
jgi:hypothetical protein